LESSWPANVGGDRDLSTPPIEVVMTEDDIPAIAVKATREAYLKAIESGQPVMIAVGTDLVVRQKGHPDKIVGQTEPWHKVPKGTVIKITKRIDETDLQ
jgi:hypothetical protein